ncbi:MAG: glycosyltransferase family 4 protein [Paracoccaceae bacterium]
MRKNVLIVVNYYFPYVSGVSEYARAVAVSLSKYHNVTVLTGRHLADLPVREKVEGYTVVRADPLFFLDKGYISPHFISCFRSLATENDVVNLHLPMLESGLLSILTSRPKLVTYQCDMAFVGSALNRLAVFGVRVSMRLALARARKVVVLSEDYALTSPIVGRFQNKSKAIAPPNRFEGEERGEVSPTQKETMICGFVGRFVEEKGIDVIVEAALILQNQPFEFWLAGDYQDVAGGSVYFHLKRKIESLGGKIRLFGRLSDSDLIDFYSSIDVLLLPSTNRFEAFGMVQMEAMTFGAIVVTSDLPGVRETVQRTGIGQLCTAGSAQSLVDAILRAQYERQNIERKEVQAAVLRTFGNEKFTKDYRDLIETMSSDESVR